jgi:hypothetical protein
MIQKKSNNCSGFRISFSFISGYTIIATLFPKNHLILKLLRYYYIETNEVLNILYPSFLHSKVSNVSIMLLTLLK